MTNERLTDYSNDALLAEADRLAEQARHTTTALIRVLIEVERRRLHLSLGYSSLFGYCTTRLRLSEAAAYSRITAARWARLLPAVLEYIDDGSLTLSGLNRLAAHLTLQNGQRLLDAARFKSTREVEKLVAAIHAQAPVPTMIRAVPTMIRAVPTAAMRQDASTESAPLLDRMDAPGPDMMTGETKRADTSPVTLLTGRPLPTRAVPQPPLAPIAADRFLLRVTIGKDTHDKLERLRALMRHRNPSGDVASILDEALTLLLARVERERCGRTTRRSQTATRADVPSTAPIAATAPESGQGSDRRRRSRRVPASLRRAIWARDGGRCAFVGEDGRCEATAFLEIHHIQPFAAGGPTTIDNLALRCRAHNDFEAAVFFGDRAGDERAGARGG